MAASPNFSENQNPFAMVAAEMSLSWGAFIPTFVGILAAFITALILARAQSRIAKQKERRRMLEECYGPLEQAIMRSNFLHRRFVKRFKAESPKFEALPFLLKTDRSALNADEKELLKQIVKANATIEKLVMEKAGLVNDNQLSTTLLPALLHHILIFQLVEEGALTGEVADLKADVFPEEVLPAIQSKKRSLERSLGINPKHKKREPNGSLT